MHIFDDSIPIPSLNCWFVFKIMLWSCWLWLWFKSTMCLSSKPFKLLYHHWCLKIWETSHIYIYMLRCMFANLRSPGDPGEEPRGAGEVAARGAARRVWESRGGTAPQRCAARRLQATERRLGSTGDAVAMAMGWDGERCGENMEVYRNYWWFQGLLMIVGIIGIDQWSC